MSQEAEVVREEAQTVVDNSEPTSGESETLSALQENIKKKGENAYYYAHGTNIGSEYKATVGHSLPQLLRVDTPAVPEAPQLKKSLITKYSWADAKDKAKVYVDLPNASEISNDAITISHDKRSFTLIINTGTESQHLIVTDLSTDINDVTFKKMTKSVVVTLHKVAPTTWFDLREPELAYANRDY